MCFLFSFQHFGVSSSFRFHNYICEDFIHDTNHFFGSQLELLWVLFSHCISWEGHVIVKIITMWRPLPCENCHNVKTTALWRPPFRVDHHIVKTTTSRRPPHREDHCLTKTTTSWKPSSCTDPQREPCNEYFDVGLDICWMFVGCLLDVCWMFVGCLLDDVGCWLFYSLWK